MNAPETLDGYMKNALGHLVPIDAVDPIDIERNDLVLSLVERAKVIKDTLLAFKMDALGDVEALVQLSADKYSIKMGGKKGNVSLYSYDGRYKLTRQNSDCIKFDERLQVAKELIDQCIHRWSEGADSKIKALVEQAFQVDKEGNISVGRILALRSIKIDDTQWKDAMETIGDSITVTGTTTYIRLYERVGDSDRYQLINLDISKL